MEWQIDILKAKCYPCSNFRSNFLGYFLPGQSLYSFHFSLQLSYVTTTTGIQWWWELEEFLYSFAENTVFRGGIISLQLYLFPFLHGLLLMHIFIIPLFCHCWWGWAGEKAVRAPALLIVLQYGEYKQMYLAWVEIPPSTQLCKEHETSSTRLWLVCMIWFQLSEIYVLIGHCSKF